MLINVWYSLMCIRCLGSTDGRCNTQFPHLGVPNVEMVQCILVTRVPAAKAANHEWEEDNGGKLRGQYSAILASAASSNADRELLKVMVMSRRMAEELSGKTMTRLGRVPRRVGSLNLRPRESGKTQLTLSSMVLWRSLIIPRFRMQ